MWSNIGSASMMVPLTFAMLTGGNTVLAGSVVNPSLPLQRSINVLQDSLQNARGAKYTQDVERLHMLLRESFGGNSDTTRLLHVYEEDGLQYDPDLPLYESATRHWGWNGSSWVSFENRQYTGHSHSQILSSLNPHTIEHYFETFTATQMDPRDITIALVPKVQYDTQVLYEMQSSLMPGSVSQPDHSIWDLSIRLHLHLSKSKWWPTSDNIRYTWDPIDYLLTSNTVNVFQLHDKYTHNVRAVSLPHGAPPSRKRAVQQTTENAPGSVRRSQSNGGVLLANDYVDRYHENGVSNDKAFWSRSSNQLYLTAQNTSGGNQSIQPGDSVAMTVSDNSGPISGNQKATWYCDSPDVTWKRVVNTEIFQAKKPGIYTVQAKLGSKYSVPMVLVVGFSKLKSVPIPVPQSASGVMPLPKVLTKEPGSMADLRTKNMMTTPWKAQGTWIPVSGKTDTRATSMYVQIYSPTTGVNWSYQIPVNQNHEFGARLRSPSNGTVRVILIPDYFQGMNRQTAGHYGKSFSPAASSTYLVPVHGIVPSVLQRSLWASAWFDYNLSPTFNDVASRLVENSPSLQTAIAAISNQVSTELTYNESEYLSGLLFQQDAIKTLHIGTGMCMDYSDVQVAMLNSMGIPTQILGGQEGAVGHTIAAGHVWTQVWDGKAWEWTDVTFDGTDGTNVLTNAWFGDTSEFSLTHVLHPGETGAYLPTPSWG